jgi:hypothetical protein
MKQPDLLPVTRGAKEKAKKRRTNVIRAAMEKTKLDFIARKTGVPLLTLSFEFVYFFLTDLKCVCSVCSVS